MSCSSSNRHAFQARVGARARQQLARCALLALLAPGAGALASDFYVYPANGQSDEQLGRDRYECHRWAVGETGFDPMRMTDRPPPRVVRVPVARNEAAGATIKGAAGGAVAGAVIGAGTQNHGGGGQGAVIGAMIGTVVGAAIEDQGERNAREAAEAQARAQADELAQEQTERALGRANYRRAMAACLEGRGYTVR